MLYGSGFCRCVLHYRMLASAFVIQKEDMTEDCQRRVMNGFTDKPSNDFLGPTNTDIMQVCDGRVVGGGLL